MACMKDGFVENQVLDGRFLSVSSLNHGSFGMVFLAKDMTSGELVAIKCLSKAPSLHNPAVSGDDHSVELACHDRLGSHPNIVNLLHSFETDAHIYLVLEFCSMGDLYEAIRLGQGPLETENVREFMLQLVNAVDFMHSKGLYHRDIKPENIFLAQDGSVKLGDFGLATTDAWSYEASVGSDRYMAPEQYDPADSGYSPAKADTWAIGICLLNVLFSRNPFVTPTESDILFADFARDNQSLFDIFPNMSQDTFEVLVHAMALDPAKRSLGAVRDSLERVITFTTDEEVLDDFCTEDREVVPASANREPLRTPSIQSPHVDQGAAFPWAKALHMSPPGQARQLSAIPDTESYTEDLFPASELDRTSWYSVAGHNSSLASGLDSTLGMSYKSMALQHPVPRILQRTEPVDVPTSQPDRTITPLPTISSAFGKKGSDSKSWTDIWEEDEEDLLEREEAIKHRRAYNARSWSQESEDDHSPHRRTGVSELKNTPTFNSRTEGSNQHRHVPSMDGVNENDGFFFEDVAPKTTPRYSPPSKRTIMDKWAALGNRRRAYQGSESSVESGKRRRNMGNWRDGLGLKVFSGNMGWGSGKDRDKDKDDSRVREWRRDTHAHQQRADDQGDFEWVGGWHDLHL